ncbi:MAG: radical SAM protein, partial [Candidatus Heimdallarchaeota archaeon]|nr:radical SAM protein [Candidatus Heimdallarchaeota archaeon]
ASIPYRLRNIDNLIEELRYLKQIGIDEVHFPDFTFTGNREHCFKICQRLVKDGLNITWDCLARVDCFDRELAVLMKQAGCHTIQFGVETKNEEVLKSMGKPVSNKAVIEAFSLCAKLNIKTIGFFIIGLPGEDKVSLQKTIAFAREIDCDYAAFSIYVPDYCSQLRQEMIDTNPSLSDQFHFDRTSFPVIDNGFLKKQELWDMRNKAIQDFYFRPEYLWKRLKGIRSLREFKTAIRGCYSLLKQGKG